MITNDWEPGKDVHSGLSTNYDLATQVWEPPQIVHTYEGYSASWHDLQSLRHILIGSGGVMVRYSISKMHLLNCKPPQQSTIFLPKNTRCNIIHVPMQGDRSTGITKTCAEGEASREKIVRWNTRQNGSQKYQLKSFHGKHNGLHQ